MNVYNINEALVGNYDEEYLKRAEKIDEQLQHVIDVFKAIHSDTSGTVERVGPKVRKDLIGRFYASCLHKVYSALMRAQNDLVDSFSTAYLAASSVSLLDETSGYVFEELKSALKRGQVFDKRAFVPTSSRPTCRTRPQEDLSAATRLANAAKNEATNKLNEIVRRVPPGYFEKYVSFRKSVRTGLSVPFDDYKTFIDFLDTQAIEQRQRAAKGGTTSFNFATEKKKLEDAYTRYEDLEKLKQEAEERAASTAQASNPSSGPRQKEDKVKGKSKDFFLSQQTLNVLYAIAILVRIRRLLRHHPGRRSFERQCKSKTFFAVVRRLFLRGRRHTEVFRFLCTSNTERRLQHAGGGGVQCVRRGIQIRVQIRSDAARVEEGLERCEFHQ